MSSEYRNLELEDRDEIIEMALLDKVSFNTIKKLFGLDQNQVKLLMKAELKPGGAKSGESGLRNSLPDAVFINRRWSATLPSIFL